MATERDIMHAVGEWFVLRTHRAYEVRRNTATHSVGDSAYARTDDGLSLAKARADYRARPARNYGREDVMETDVKVGDKVKANGWTRDNLGVGTVVAVDHDERGLNLTVKWATKATPGDGWRVHDVRKL